MSIFTYLIFIFYNGGNMAKLKGGTEAMISGKVGGLVFFDYFGERHVRMAPKERKKGSWSPKQQAHRKRFSAIYAFWGQYDGKRIQRIWKLAAEQMHAINLFMKINMPAFGSEGELMDLERLHFSTGHLPLPHLLNAARMPADLEKIEVSWQNDSGSAHARTNDELLAMIAHDGKFTGPIETGIVRKTGNAVIQIPSGIETVQGIYLFFASKERMLYSTDQYFKL
jgi:hypothetical protein